MTIIACSIDSSLLSLRNNTLVLPRPDVIQRPLEMALRALEAGVWLILVCLQVRMDELDEAVEVLGRDGFVLLVKVVDVAVEDLDEEFNRDGGVHASVCDAESTLEAFEDALAVAVELSVMVSCCVSQFSQSRGGLWLTFWGSSSLCGFSTIHQRWLARYTARHWSGFLSSLLPCNAVLVMSVS